MERRQFGQGGLGGQQIYASHNQPQSPQDPRYIQPNNTTAEDRRGQNSLDAASIRSNNSPNTRLSPLTLPNLIPQNNSTTSLLEAVIGRAPTPPPKSTPQTACKAQTIQPRASSTHSSERYNSASASPSASGDHATSFGTNTEREWDVLSDESLRLNEGEGEGEVVEELQKKVNRRRSNLPHLESQLAALEAKIKAAEEKLARAQKGQAGSLTQRV